MIHDFRFTNSGDKNLVLQVLEENENHMESYPGEWRNAHVNDLLDVFELMQSRFNKTTNNQVLPQRLPTDEELRRICQTS